MLFKRTILRLQLNTNPEGTMILYVITSFKKAFPQKKS
jgi:hypothetical protein